MELNNLVTKMEKYKKIVKSSKSMMYDLFMPIRRIHAFVSHFTAMRQLFI